MEAGNATDSQPVEGRRDLRKRYRIQRTLSEALRYEAEKDRRTYKVIAVSMYKDDLNELDQLVDKLKKQGIRSANRSALIRIALRHLHSVSEAITEETLLKEEL